jgi:hypothetical protein
MGLFQSKNASTKKIPTRKITSGLNSQNEESGLNSKNKESNKTKDPMAAAAILGVISGAISGVTSIWSTSNNLKSKRAEADLLAKEIDLESEKGKSATLLAALEVKKEEVQRLEAQEKANANIRGIIYAGAFLLVGFVAYLMFGPKKQQKTAVIA